MQLDFPIDLRYIICTGVIWCYPDALIPFALAFYDSLFFLLRMPKRGIHAIVPTCVVALGFVYLGALDGRPGDRGRNSVLTDTDKNYTTIGNIGLTITNFGTIGTRNAYWPTQPSCEYPRGSRIEHLYQGGLWVGAQSRRTGQIHVSTGSSDQVSMTTGKGLEFTSDPSSDLIQG